MVLLMAGLALGPNKPVSTNAALSAIVANVSGDPQLQALSGALNILGAILFLGYATISAAARRTHSFQHQDPWATWMAGAAATFVVFAVLDVVVDTALSFIAQQGSLSAEPELTRLMYHLYDGILMPGVAHLALAGYLALVAIGAFTGRLRPQWIAWPSALLAVMALINGFVGLTVSTGGAFPLAPITVFGFIVVTIAGSISMLREVRTAAASQAEAVKSACGGITHQGHDAETSTMTLPTSPLVKPPRRRIRSSSTSRASTVSRPGASGRAKAAPVTERMISAWAADSRRISIA
jgi:hypothetical protein